MAMETPVTTTEIDGPIEPDSFVWQDRLYQGLSPTAWRLVKALWYSPSRAEPLNRLAGSVFELDAMHERHLYAPHAVRANSWFKWHALPFRIRVRRDYLQLIEGPG